MEPRILRLVKAFLASSGAQGITMSGTNLSREHNFQLSLLALLPYFERRTEPKPLRLVGNLPRIARTASSLTISIDPLEMK